MPIAIFDNDILVTIFDEIYLADKNKFEKVMEFLTWRFNRIWIPKEVMNEFFRIRKRRSRLERIMRNYPIIEYCPITIAKHEIKLILSRNIQEGEADGIIQTRKAPDYTRYSNWTDAFVFVSNDRLALNCADNFGIDTVPYEDLRERLREMGVEI